MDAVNPQSGALIRLFAHVEELHAMVHTCMVEQRKVAFRHFSGIGQGVILGIKGFGLPTGNTSDVSGVGDFRTKMLNGTLSSA